MATYNSGKTLRNSLDSLLNQSFQDWECIISDGGSTDNTLAILEEYHSRDNRFSYKSEPDKGIYDALNKALERASGEWVYVLGSDDKVLYDGLSHLYEMVKPDAGVVYGDIYAVFADGSKKYVKAKAAKTMTYIMAPSHQGMIMRRNLMIKHQGFNIAYRVRGDFDLTQRVYLTGVDFLYKSIPVAEVLQTGLSCQLSYKNHLERYEIMKANHSVIFPYFMFWLVEIRGIIKRNIPWLYKILKLIGRNR